MGKTISSNRGSFILNSINYNPLTILGGVTVAEAGLRHLRGRALALVPAITNLGTATANGANGDGIELRDGGSVNPNGINSHITGTNGGIYAGKSRPSSPTRAPATGTNGFGVLLAAGKAGDEQQHRRDHLRCGQFWRSSHRRCVGRGDQPWHDIRHDRGGAVCQREQQ